MADFVDGCASSFSDEQNFVVTGDLPSATAPITIYPNPATDRLTVLLNGLSGNKIVSIYQMDGKRTDYKETGDSEITFPLSGYSQGVYLVNVVAGKSHHIVRFTKQ